MANTLLSIPSTGIAGSTAAQSYTEYTYTYTATQTQTYITFEFRQDPAYWGLDDVRFTSSNGTQLLTNGGFESGNLSGWTLIGTQGLAAAGQVASGSPGSGTTNSHSGSYHFYDGAVGGVDGIYQAINTTPGQQYTIDFWLAADGGGAALAQVQVGSNVYATVPANLALDPASDTGVVGDGVTSVTQPVITGTGAVGDTVTLYDGSNTIGTATTANNGTWTISPSSPLSSGSHTLTATQTDGSGNVSAHSTALTVTITPPAPTLSLAAASDTGALNDRLTSRNTPTITGTGTVGDTIRLYDSGNQVGTAVVAGNGSWSIVPNVTLTDGAHQLTATDTSTNGNTSPTSSTFTLTIDTAAPVAPSLALAQASDTGAQGDGITSVAAPTLTGSAEAGSTVTLYEGATILGTAVAGQNGAWSISAGLLAGGNHLLTATATDAAGNVSSNSQAFALTIDTVAPAVTAALLHPSAAAQITPDPTLTGTGDPGATVTVTEGSTTLGTTTADAQGRWTFAPGGLRDGLHHLIAAETDAAGNTNSAQVGFTLDTVAPVAPSLALAQASDTGAQGDGITSVAAPTLTGSAEAGSTVTLYEGATILGTIVAGQNGAWSIPAGMLADGNHLLTATATDAAGNVSSNSQAFALTIDTVAPAVTAALLHPSAAAQITPDPTLTGTGDPGATVTVTEGSTTLGTTTADAQGRWTFAPGGLLDGLHNLIAAETDAAGNTNSTQVGFTLDTTAPADALSISRATIGVYRLFDTTNGNQFFTSSISEYKALAATTPTLQLEGVELNALNPTTAAADPDAIPVYRFFDTTYGTHFFTASNDERDTVLASRPDLHYEGIGFYEHTSQQSGDSAVYRFFDVSNGTHFYTESANEQASVLATRPDMKYEGVSFYAPTPT